jgi:hypothetical protein
MMSYLLDEGIYLHAEKNNRLESILLIFKIKAPVLRSKMICGLHQHIASHQEKNHSENKYCADETLSSSIHENERMRDQSRNKCMSMASIHHHTRLSIKS